jgi:hypothetical protein
MGGRYGGLRIEIPFAEKLIVQNKNRLAAGFLATPRRFE